MIENLPFMRFSELFLWRKVTNIDKNTRKNAQALTLISGAENLKISVLCSDLFLRLLLSQTLSQPISVIKEWQRSHRIISQKCQRSKSVRSILHKTPTVALAGGGPT